MKSMTNNIVLAIQHDLPSTAVELCRNDGRVMVAMAKAYLERAGYMPVKDDGEGTPEGV